MESFYNALGLPVGPFDPDDRFVTSWLLPPAWLASLRALLSLYCFSTIFYSFAWFAHHTDTFHLQDIDLPAYTFSIGSAAIARSFSYFTYLSYWGLAFYFAVSSMHTLVYTSTGSTWLHHWPRPLQALHSVYYTSITCLPLLVSSVFWGSMWIGPWYTLPFDAWSNISIHAMNSLFTLLEITLPNTAPPPWAHLGVLLLVLSVYLALPYISHVTQDFYPYEWLDPAVGWEKIVAHILGYTLAIVTIFNAVRGLIWLRCRLTIDRKRHRNSQPPLRPHSSIRKSDEIAIYARPHWGPDDVEMAPRSSTSKETFFGPTESQVTLPPASHPRWVEKPSFDLNPAPARNFSRLNASGEGRYSFF